MTIRELQKTIFFNTRNSISYCIPRELESLKVLIDTRKTNSIQITTLRTKDLTTELFSYSITHDQKVNLNDITFFKEINKTKVK